MTFENPIAAKAALTAVVTVAAVLLTQPEKSHAQVPNKGWFKVCTKQDENDICVVQNITAASTGQLLTATGLIIVEGKVNSKTLQVSVPSARTIAPGVAMQVDGGKAQQIPYAVCMPDKCVAQVPLTDAMVNAFKQGGEIVFTSVNFQRAPNPIKVSLKGFTDAFDGEAVTPSELQERQQLLHQELQQKAQAVREKLKEAQQKAKEQN